MKDKICKNLLALTANRRIIGVLFKAIIEIYTKFLLANI